ncbi:hypothetical protein JIQ42_08007 [Leishmania sp. Namibia]|uniref:hypothetical protein n=1 Tax=Leishmania sp. Namibia TaxID=2802991 RepID=UPI001B5B34F5|nr:hypothetical protein JIQ42_08007 [Leishmania sp. Namibia]
MASSTPAQPSATLPPSLHSPPSPYSKNRASASGGSFEEHEDASARRSQLLQSQPQTPPPKQVKGRADDRSDADGSARGRWGHNTSQPSSPCTVLPSSPKTKPTVSPVGLATPPSSVAKDARLACRQYLEEAYTPTSTSEAGGESGRPQKKELRLEDCTSSSFNYRSVFSPACVLSSATSVSVDTGCTDGRDFSIFSFASSVRDNLDALNTPMCRRAIPLASSNNVAADSAETSLVAHSVPAPPSPTSSTAHSTVGRPTASAAEGNGSFASRMSKCKRRLQNLNGPAFDLKAVQEAQRGFLEEEAVCNAAQSYPMSDITSLLAVGSWKDASDPALLKKHNIGYVLNVAKELIPTEEAKMIAENNDIVSEWIPMSDSHSQDVAEHLIKAFRFIERARKEHSRVLVHCRRGISRSAAIIVAYLMASEHRSYEDALRFVTERRSCVSLNLAFQERLSEFAPSSEFFHGCSLQQLPQPLSAASPPPAPSSSTLLPTLSGATSRTDSALSAHASHFSQPNSMQKPDNPLLQPRECHSVSSSTNSSRASSGVRTAPSHCFGPPVKPRSAGKWCLQSLRTSKQASMWYSTSPSATPTSTTATSVNSASLEEVSAFHSPLRKHQNSRRGSGVPRASATPSSITRLSAQSTVTTAIPGMQGAEDEVMGTPAPESVGSRDNGGDDVEEPSSPMGGDCYRTLARFTFTQTSSSSASVESAKNLPGSYSEEEVRTINAATATVTTTLTRLNKCTPDENTAAANEEAGNREARCSSSSSSANTSENRSHLHRSPRAPVERLSAFDDISGGDDIDGSEAPESVPTTELPLLRRKHRRNSRLRSGLSADAAAAASPVTESQPFSAMHPRLPVPESGPSGSGERQDFASSEISSSHNAAVGGDAAATASTMGEPLATFCGTRSPFNEEGVAPQSPTAAHSSSILLEAISRVPSLSE